MKFILRLSLYLLCLILISCAAKKKMGGAIPGDVLKLGVVDAFNQYKSAILNDKGEEAVNFVDQKTITYYGDILEKTKYADSLQIEDMSIMDKLMVFSIRHRTPREDILSFDGKKLLVYAIKEGMVGKNSVANNEVGEVTVDDNFAKGQLIANGIEAPFFFHFYKESGAWKLDLTSLFPIGNMAFQRMADESERGENEYLFMLLEMITGKVPTQDIWKTVK